MLTSPTNSRLSDANHDLFVAMAPPFAVPAFASHLTFIATAASAMIAPCTPPIVTDVPIKTKRGWRLHLVAAVAWSVFVGFHAVALLFFGVSAYSYWTLCDSGTTQYLALHRIGMASQYYRPIAVAYGSIALVNLWLLLQMVVCPCDTSG